MRGLARARWMLAGLLAAARPASSQAPGHPCDAPEHRQLDFWIGDWDVSDVAHPDSVKGRAHIDRILDGCALRELYQNNSGLVGQSLSIYDATRKVWHQSWVTNGGQLLVIEGGMDGNRMVLIGTDHATQVLLRGIWMPDQDRVRETAETSADHGKTWKPLFDIIFRKHRS